MKKSSFVERGNLLTCINPTEDLPRVLGSFFFILSVCIQAATHGTA